MDDDAVVVAVRREQRVDTAVLEDKSWHFGVVVVPSTVVHLSNHNIRVVEEEDISRPNQYYRMSFVLPPTPAIVPMIPIDCRIPNRYEMVG